MNRLYFFTLLLCLGCTLMPKPSDALSIHAIRLLPGQDLKQELDKFAKTHQLQAAFILTCVGSLQKVCIRPANQTVPLRLEQKMEIVSLVGTISPDGMHLHISLSDAEGKTIGGHLLDGNEVFTTAEIVIGEASQLKFRRETDSLTTFKELTVYPRNKPNP